MSSPRSPLPGDAVLQQLDREGGDDRATGPLLLPRRGRNDFIKAFNRIYRSIGLSIRLAEPGKDRQPSGEE